MIIKIKKLFYFPLAYYFRFFAKIRLNRWKPRVIIITGSSGKTTLLNLVESQIESRAKYSHHTNSSYGIPFNILGLERRTLSLSEWPFLFLFAPIKIFTPVPKKKFYIVEADCDRPNEGRFLTALLKPEVTLWTNSTRSHSMNFDPQVKNGKFKSVEKAIGYEYGYFIENTSKLVVTNGDSVIIKGELSRTKAKVVSITIKNLQNYKISHEGTEFKSQGKIFRFRQLLPKENFYTLEMCLNLLSYLRIPSDESFSKFILPPGRSSLLSGIKNTKIIDSSYNANLDSMAAILDMFDKIPAEKKWAILGDMLEQGQEEKEEHEKLAKIISRMLFDRIILIGPRVSRYTYPELKKILNRKVKIEKFEKPKEVLNYLRSNIKGGEFLLFKGARFLEGVIENLLVDKKDVLKLARREEAWEKRRKSWGL